MQRGTARLPQRGVCNRTQNSECPGNTQIQDIPNPFPQPQVWAGGRDIGAELWLCLPATPFHGSRGAATLSEPVSRGTPPSRLKESPSPVLELHRCPFSNWYSHCGKLTVRNHVTQPPFLCVFYPQKVKPFICKDICTPMVTEALIVMAGAWK